MPKPPSKQSQQTARSLPSAAQVEALANALADRPYGVASATTPVQAASVVGELVKRKTLSISLPPDLIERLEDAALKNKRAGEGPKSVSAIVLAALAAAGY
mgnify:CR=1 FL=1